METILVSKLPGGFAVFSPLVDVLPAIPVLFLLLALYGKLVLDLNKFNI